MNGLLFKHTRKSFQIFGFFKTGFAGRFRRLCTVQFIGALHCDVLRHEEREDLHILEYGREQPVVITAFEFLYVNAVQGYLPFGRVVEP